MRKVFTKEQEDSIIYDYVVLKEGRKKIGAKFGVSDSKILNILKKHGVHIRSIQEANSSRYKINEDFFTSQNENMAYLLGLIASDGCISNTDNQIYIELKREDKDLLIKVNNLLQNEREVKDYETGRGYLNSKIYFYSSKIKKDLRDYNIVPNKTYSKDFKFPNMLQKQYYWDFIRGYFDGNGSTVNAGGSIRWQLDTPSEDMANKICAFLNENDIAATIEKLPKVNIVIYRVYAYNKTNAKKIFDFLYKDKTIFLQRKKDKFISLMK